jgi:hypothetical protein
MTKAEALSLLPGTTLTHNEATNADGSQLRCRVSGKPIERKNYWYVPVKYGLSTSFRITDQNVQYWSKS